MFYPLIRYSLPRLFHMWKQCSVAVPLRVIWAVGAETSLPLNLFLLGDLTRQASALVRAGGSCPNDAGVARYH